MAHMLGDVTYKFTNIQTKKTEAVLKSQVIFCLFQVHRLCHPCQVKYDFVGRLETLETDAELLLKLLEVDQLVHFPLGARNRTTTSWEKDWFAEIPLTMRRDLYKLYEPDFELFGYPKPDSVLHQ